MTAAKEIVRCAWLGIADAEYTRYHDDEWGVPKSDDKALLEKLVLEGFQAGLSWITILRKRENFRKAFHGFDAEKVARYGARDIDNAKAYLKLRERTSLAKFLWDFLDGKPQIHERQAMREIPPETPESKAISKALKKEGFRFVGPTTVYAFMQSSGFVNDHLVDCHRHAACAALQRKFKAPKK
jgi:DNA-3-methyladenine glycosylase I